MTTTTVVRPVPPPASPHLPAANGDPQAQPRRELLGPEEGDLHQRTCRCRCREKLLVWPRGDLVVITCCQTPSGERVLLLPSSRGCSWCVLLALLDGVGRPTAWLRFPKPSQQDICVFSTAAALSSWARRCCIARRGQRVFARRTQGARSPNSSRHAASTFVLQHLAPQGSISIPGLGKVMHRA